MKSDTSSPKLPTGKAQWEKIIALAPGEDRLHTTAENAARKNAVSVAGGGYAAVRDALVKKRQGQRNLHAIFPVCVSTYGEN
jgi:hypothetical protein